MLLEKQIREEIMEKISNEVGYKVREENLPPWIKQSITNIISIKKNLLILEEIYKGERGRVANSVILKLTGKVKRNDNLDQEYEKILKLKSDLNIKIILIAKEVLALQFNRPLSQQTENKEESSLKIMELKCPKCNAPLPFPNSYKIQCKYCGTTFLIGDILTQMDSIIKNI